MVRGRCRSVSTSDCLPNAFWMASRRASMRDCGCSCEPFTSPGSCRRTPCDGTGLGICTGLTCTGMSVRPAVLGGDTLYIDAAAGAAAGAEGTEPTETSDIYPS